MLFHAPCFKELLNKIANLYSLVPMAAGDALLAGCRLRPAACEYISFSNLAIARVGGAGQCLFGNLFVYALPLMIYEMGRALMLQLPFRIAACGMDIEKRQKANSKYGGMTLGSTFWSGNANDRK